MRSALVLLILAALVSASGCEDGGGKKVVLTRADVRGAFEHQGLDLAPYEVGPGIPALGYPCAGCSGVRIVCEIYGSPVIARGIVKTVRDKRPGNISRALRAKNVAVLLDPAATPDEVQRTLRAVAELR